jgi:hypothetical protein
VALARSRPRPADLAVHPSVITPGTRPSDATA